MIPVREAGHHPDLADHRGRDDRADAEDAGEGGAGGPDGNGELLLGIAHLGIDAAQVLQELGGELTAGGFHPPAGLRPSRSRPAWGALIRLETPPATSSHSTACSRHTTWVRARPRSRCRLVVGFSLPARAAVDQRYAELTAAGYPGRQPPFDAFWGARYAIVADPTATTSD